MRKQNAVIMVWGAGGHSEQMKRVVAKLEKPSDVIFVGMSDSSKSIPGIERIEKMVELREKYGPFGGWLTVLQVFGMHVRTTLRVFRKYRVLGMVSTGPGLALVPMVVCRLLGRRIVFFESWSRTSSKSWTGKVAAHLAGLFYVQHEGLLKQYPRSRYRGIL